MFTVAAHQPLAVDRCISHPSEKSVAEIGRETVTRFPAQSSCINVPSRCRQIPDTCGPQLVAGAPASPPGSNCTCVEFAPPPRCEVRLFVPAAQPEFFKACWLRRSASSFLCQGERYPGLFVTRAFGDLAGQAGAAAERRQSIGASQTALEARAAQGLGVSSQPEIRKTSFERHFGGASHRSLGALEAQPLFAGHPVWCSWARVASGKCWTTQGEARIAKQGGRTVELQYYNSTTVVPPGLFFARPGEEALQLLTACRLKECGGSLAEKSSRKQRSTSNFLTRKARVSRPGSWRQKHVLGGSRRGCQWQAQPFFSITSSTLA